MPDEIHRTDLFEIIRTTRSMRRLKPDPVPNELIRKILKAGVCAPSGGNMQRWRFLVIHDPKVKETVGALYKRAWDEQVAPRYRSGEPAPDMRQGTIHTGPHGCAWPDIPPRRRRDTNPHVWLVHLSCGAEHAAAGESPRPRHNFDDTVLAVREGSGGCARLATRCPLVCLAAEWLPDGTVRASPPCRACRCRL
jgi:hypothetical protein